MTTNIVFRTTNGFEVHLFPITIELGNRAILKTIQMSTLGVYQKDYILEGDDYKAWGADDDFVKHHICSKETYMGQLA
jgi:hypothetical protein